MRCADQIVQSGSDPAFFPPPLFVFFFVFVCVFEAQDADVSKAQTQQWIVAAAAPADGLRGR